MRSVARGSTFTCASVFSARATIACVSSRRAFGSAISTRSIVVLLADALEFVGRAEHAHAAHRATAQVGVVVDETDDEGVAVHAAHELARECCAGVAGSDDQRPELVVGLHRALSFEREQPRLETNATAAEQDQQRGDRWGREHRERAVAELVDDDQLDRGSDRAAGDCEHDARGFLDRGVPPDGPVQARELVCDQLGDDGQREEQQWSAEQVVRNAPFEPGEVREQPRDGDDARVEDAQARVVQSARDAVDGAREPALVTRRARRRRCHFGRCRSIHDCRSLLALRTRPGHTLGVTLGRTPGHGSCSPNCVPA